MKFINAAILLFALMVTLPACGGGNNSKKELVSKEAKTINLTKAQFLKLVANYEESPNEWKYLGDKPAIVDFYADWCAPCRALAPVLEELAAEYNGKIYIYKVDTMAEKELAGVFGIRSIPTMLFIPIGEQPQIAQGALPKEALKEAIEKTLLKL